MSFEVQLEHKESTEAGRRASDRLAAADPWFSLAKNVAWIIGLVAIGTLKFSRLEEINTAQNVEIARIKVDLKEKIDSSDTRFREMNIKLQSIETKQVELLVLLTELRTRNTKNGR